MVLFGDNDGRVRCGVTYASFSKVTVADFWASASPETGVTEMWVIFPL